MQKEAFKNLYTNMEGTLIYLDESIKSAEAKRQVLLEQYIDLLLEKVKYGTYESYEETYLFKLPDLYKVHDGASAQGDSSFWEFTSMSTKGHKNAIANTGNIKSKESMATTLKFKYKYVFDTRIYFAWLIKDQGSSGIMINYKDEFNYYCLEISVKGFRYIRV